MALSSGKPTAQNHNSQRRHTDPSVLWVAVSLGSIGIHVFGFWMLRLLLMGRFEGLQSTQELIPVEIITVADKITSPSQPIKTPETTATSNPTPVNTPFRRTSDESFQRQITSSSTPSSNRANFQETLTQKQPPVRNPVPNQQQPTPAAPQPPVPNQQQPTPAAPQPPVPNQQQPTPAAPQPPVSNQQQPTPAAPQPSATNPDSNPAPNASTQAQQPSSQQGGGILVSVPIEIQRSVLDRDIPTQEAKPKFENPQFISSDQVAQLLPNLEQPIELKVLVVIDDKGQPTLQSAQVLQGNSNVEPYQLAQAIIKDWEFEPAYMEGRPVYQEYWVQVTITPTARSN